MATDEIMAVNGNMPAVLSSSTAIRKALPTIDLQYEYRRRLEALKRYTKDRTTAIAELESQAALAETLPEAMERGDVKSQDSGHYVLINFISNDERSARINGNEVNLWRKIASIPEDLRQQYYAKAEGRPTRNGLLAWHKTNVFDLEMPGCNHGPVESLAGSGPWSTLYADPPWKYGNQGTRASTNNHYPTLTVAQICELPVASIAADKSILFIWTTNGFLQETLNDVIPAWGFTFKSSMVWVKPQMGIGNYVRNAHEFLLIANRGGLIPNGKSQISWVQSDRKKHSAKPEVFHDIIEAMAPAPRLELFARKTRSDWSTWGNEVENMLL